VDIQRSLFWHQGLFLQPQHFQMTEMHVQSLFAPYNKFLQPFFWGVGNLEISPGALDNLSFDILQGEFLFPDGTYTQMPGNAVIQSRSFETDWVDRDQPFGVYIGLKKYDFSKENVTVVSKKSHGSGVSTRFSTTEDQESIIDLHTNGPVGNLQYLDLVLKIFWEGEVEQAGDYHCIPIAKLEMQGAEVRLKHDYIPPSLTIQHPNHLLKIIRNIRDLLASRSRQLEEYKSQRGLHSADFGSRDMVFLLALRSLNRYVPLLFHYTEGGAVHPWIVYGVLRQLIGELSTFSTRYNVVGESLTADPPLEPYSHKDLGACFNLAETIVIALVDEITAGPDFVIPLEYDGTYFAAELPPGVFEGRNRFYLVAETESDPDETVDLLENIAKFGTRESLPLLIARALPGVGVESLAVPPQELPRRSHCLYFQLDHHADEWFNVQQSQNFALYWDGAPDDFKIELMVVGRV